MRCESIVVNMEGIQEVRYNLAWPNKDFVGEPAKGSLKNWRKMAAGAEVLHVAGE